MYQRLDGFHPIFTKSYLDEENGDLGPGTHHHQHSIMVEGYSNHGNWIPVLSSLKIWHLCKVSKTGRGCPSFFGSISHACTRARARAHHARVTYAPDNI